MNKISKLIIYSLFLPLFLFRDIIKSDRSIVRKILYFLLVFVVFGMTWWNWYVDIFNSINYNLFQLGITDKITKIKVSGTSMLPAIIDGQEITLSSPKKYGLKREDIVAFTNNETNGFSYIKRIIALPGEQVSIRNGYYYINGKALEEDYTLNNLPTFGNTYLADCDNITIPKDQYFVSGDNRTVSSDSRILGPIKKDDIEGVIKTNITEKFATEQKQTNLLKQDISPEIFLKKLNEQREKNKVSGLVTHDILNNLAGKRVIEIKDHFKDWKNKAIPVDKLLETSGYRYNLVHEFVTFGYLDEQNIIDQIFDLSTEKDIFLSGQYTEVGLGVVEATNNECHFPIISVILSWPTIPTYDQKVIDSWSKEISATNKVLADLQSWVDYANKDQSKLRQAINTNAQANEIANRIYQKMVKREWLLSKDYQDIRTYDELVQQSNSLLDNLFGKVKGVQTQRGEGRKL